MSTRAKTFAVVAALAAMVVAFRGTAQAALPVYTVPNYNFQDSADAGLPDGVHYNYPEYYYTDPSGRPGYTPDWWFQAQGDSMPYYAGEWNPTSSSFTTAGGNGMAPLPRCTSAPASFARKIVLVTR